LNESMIVNLHYFFTTSPSPAVYFEHASNSPHH
jgi:hypothetical protein